MTSNVDRFVVVRLRKVASSVRNTEQRVISVQVSDLALVRSPSDNRCESHLTVR
jgi:hypothetical protein